MNKTYTMDKEVRSSFKRILKDISHNADLSWTEQTDDTHSHFTVDCSENVIGLVDKFSAKLGTVNLIIRTKSKFQKDIEEITFSLNGKFAKGTQKGYFIISLDRVHQKTFRSLIEQRNIDMNISQSMF